MWILGMACRGHGFAFRRHPEHGPRRLLFGTPLSPCATLKSPRWKISLFCRLGFVRTAIIMTSFLRTIGRVTNRFSHMEFNHYCDMQNPPE